MTVSLAVPCCMIALQVELWGQCPPIDKLDTSLSALTACRWGYTLSAKLTIVLLLPFAQFLPHSEGFQNFDPRANLHCQSALVPDMSSIISKVQCNAPVIVKLQCSSLCPHRRMISHAPFFSPATSRIDCPGMTSHGDE